MRWGTLERRLAVENPQLHSQIRGRRRCSRSIVDILPKSGSQPAGLEVHGTRRGSGPSGIMLETRNTAVPTPAGSTYHTRASEIKGAAAEQQVVSDARSWRSPSENVPNPPHDLRSATKGTVRDTVGWLHSDAALLLPGACPGLCCDQDRSQLFTQDVVGFFPLSRSFCLSAAGYLYFCPPPFQIHPASSAVCSDALCFVARLVLGNTVY